MMRLRFAIRLWMHLFVLTQLLWAGPCRAEVFRDIRVGGFLKSLNLYLQASPLGTYPSGFASYNQQRANITGKSWDRFSFEVAVENRLTLSQNQMPNLDSYGNSTACRYLDLEKELCNDSRSLDTLYADRLNISTQIRHIKLTAGRQAIGFGRIALLSPLDVISPFSPEAIDTEVRSGVDAIQAVRYFGLGGQLGAAVVLGDDNEHNAYLITFSHNIEGFDILAMAGSLQDRPMAGFGLATDIGGWGLKAEVSLYKGKDIDAPSGDLHDTFAVGAVEAWYRFENGLNFLAEYLYNGAGAKETAAYTDVLSSAFTRDGLNDLAGQHYLILGPAYNLHPLVQLEALVLWNLDDSSMLIRPLLDISLTDNLDLQTFYAFYSGREPVRNSDTGLTGTTRSEFGSSGDYGGLWLKFYF
jgi:hypothetical protein